jgi:hypothetical protein
LALYRHWLKDYFFGRLLVHPEAAVSDATRHFPAQQRLRLIGAGRCCLPLASEGKSERMSSFQTLSHLSIAQVW